MTKLCAYEVELAVVAMAMYFTEITQTAEWSLLTESHFEDYRTRPVFRGINTCVERGWDPDMNSVLAVSKEVKGPSVAELAGMMDEVPSGYKPETFRNHIIVLNEYRLKRLAQSILVETNNLLLDESNQPLKAISHCLTEMGSLGIKEVRAAGFTDEVPEVVEIGSKSSSLTGFRELDEYIGSIGTGNLIYIGGKQGAGKTTLAVNIFDNMVLDEGRCCFFVSREMNSSKIWAKMFSKRTGIPYKQIRSGELDEDEARAVRVLRQRLVKKKTACMSRSKIDYSISGLELAIAQLNHKKGGKLSDVFIDYIQLIVSGGGSASERSQAIAKYSVGFKEIAVKYDLNIWCISRLNRGPDIQFRAPIPSDLAECSQLEYDADVVLFVHPAMTKVGNSQIIDSEGRSMVHVMVSKGREGETHCDPGISMAFNKPVCRFEE